LLELSILASPHENNIRCLLKLVIPMQALLVQLVEQPKSLLVFQLLQLEETFKVSLAQGGAVFRLKGGVCLVQLVRSVTKNLNSNIRSKFLRWIVQTKLLCIGSICWFGTISDEWVVELVKDNLL